MKRILPPIAPILPLLTLAVVPVLTMACSTGTTYVDPARPQGAAGWGALEVKQTTSAMATDLFAYLSEKHEPIFIAFKPIRNRSSEHIETEMLASQIRSSLIERKIYFVQLNLRGEIMKEMALGQSGLIDDSAISIGNLKSPNYYLEGMITDATNFTDGRSVQYIVVTLSLTRAQSGVIEWSRNKEFLKSTKSDTIGW